jgi:hypothetical protein
MNIKSVLDAPCGDCNWQHEIFDFVDSYVGVDIVERNILNNSKKFKADKNVSFYHADLVDFNADLIICRDMLIHLSNDAAMKVLNNFKASGSKYLLTTNYLKINENEEIPDGSYRPINLSLAPFALPVPDFTFPEKYWFSDDFGRSMSLWKLSDI